VNYRLADVSKAERLLDLKSQVSLEEGLSRLVEWWRMATVRKDKSVLSS
jgi:UDP-glucose 4-epimerase